MDNTQEYILCAAIKRLSPKNIKHNPYYKGTNDILNIEIGFRHNDILLRFQGEVSKNPRCQGFYTSKGRYVNRTEAMDIALSAHQVNKDTIHSPSLFSENLY